ncbi:MAG: sodium-translocating pyrophosphatase [Elusimicrobiota bacterium]|jgi:K(+)-stimulated pyrophosphate-energized sodium pump
MKSLLYATAFETYAVWSVFGIAVLGLIYALLLRAQILRKDKGTPEMQEIWGAIRQGADAYLERQLKTILPLIALLTVLLFFSVYIVPPTTEAMQRFSSLSPDQVRLVIGIGRALSFVMGAFFSLLVGQFGMRMAIEGNVRVASAARRGFAEALQIAYRSGTITGMLTDGLGLLGGTAIFILFGVAAPDALLGFGFGGTLLALFMRVGGGIFTKAADVGADLVGKVEAGVPEDDPRNAAVIADLVGDNVGDCAGMAADIFESYEVTIVSGLILGLALVSMTHELKWIIFPLLVRGIGVLSSIIGTYVVTGDAKGRKADAMSSINHGFYTSAAISVFAFFLLAYFYMHEWRAFLSVSVGILLAIVLDEVTKYFTHTEHKPVKAIAASSRTGAATLLLRGLAVGCEASVWQILVIAATILAAVMIYHGQPVIYVFYGVAMTGIGMLTLTGNNVAMDAFGPIADNANGIGEMARLEPAARQIMADLDAVGNTTKAITKGVAIGSAVIAAVSLFGSYLSDVSSVQARMGLPENLRLLSTGIRVSEPMVFIGLLIGGSLPWLFSSIMISAVARAAALIVTEVRRQFRIPGLMEGRVQPDYRQAVGICTVAAQKELLGLALIAVLAPLVIGISLQVEALGGFLAGVILSGQLLAVFMAVTGGAWDNAKKLIEDGLHGGKGSKAHEASVVGDTVGDPLKDTAGPALNPMIKVLNLVALLAAPILVRYDLAHPGLWVVLLVSALLIIGAVLYSKRETADAESMQEIPGDQPPVPLPSSAMPEPAISSGAVPSVPANYRLYCLVYPMEALVASMLSPEEFATYLAIGTRKIARGKVVFLEVEPGFASHRFDWERAHKECVPTPDGRPKKSVYLGIYRVLEHVPLKSIRNLFLVTRDGRVLSLAPQHIAGTADHPRQDGAYLYQELCPVRPLVVSRLDPLDLGRFMTDPSNLLHIPRIFFARLKLGENPRKIVEEASLPYDNLAHIQDCVREVLDEGKATKTVERSSPDGFFYSTITDGFYLAEQKGGLYFPFPKEEELKDRYYQWWRSAV